MNDNKRFTPWIVALLVVILDQGSKWIIRSQMELHQSIPVLGDLLRITYIHNDGLAFGVNTPFGRWLGVLSLVATLVVVILLLRMKSSPFCQKILLGSIMGGAIGNTIDRLFLGHVVDFIDVDLPDWMMERWPVFNIADSAVSVGVTLLIITLLFTGTPTDESDKKLVEDISTDNK